MPEKLATIPEDKVEARLQRDLPGWTLEKGWIRRKFTTDGWPTTLMLVNAIGFLAEAAFHHPDLEVTWGKLWVKLQTHSAGGITERDFALAIEIEKLALWRPAAGSALEGTTEKWVSAKKEP
jgi:4a-hydroxytetrahydrobiopterin dehydratase